MISCHRRILVSYPPPPRMIVRYDSSLQSRLLATWQCWLTWTTIWIEDVPL